MSRFITIEEFSNNQGIEITLVREFVDFGLIPIHIEQNAECLETDDIGYVQRLIRLYQDLGVNKEGIEIILSMREQILGLSKEVEILKYKSRRLEQEQEQKLKNNPNRNGLLFDHDEWL
jgi:hypothetical protein